MLFPRETRPIVLRPYQLDSEEKLRAGIRAGRRRQVLVAPTAFGKTEVGAHIIQQSQEKGARAWFIVDRVSLIDQTSERFHGYGIEHGVIQADHFLKDLKKPVQIASAQTLARRRLDILPDLIIVDEAHCRYKATIDLIGRAVNAKVIGLTATPFTAGMAEDWDGLVNGATVNQLLADGFLTPLKIKACVSPDMKDVKRKLGGYGEYDEEESGARGITIIGDVVQTWVEQTQRFFGGPVKTIVFSPSVRHGAELCRQFAAAGFNFQQISYLDASDDERRAKIAEFRKPDSAIHGLISCAVLTKGFDVPDVMCGISCRPYAKSFSSHIQELGRVMRIAPGKEFGLWLDHSGNCISFAEDTSWLYEYGVDTLSDAQKKDSEVRKPPERKKSQLFCGECGMQMEAKTEACPYCGWERPKRGEIQIVAGELIDFDVTTRESFAPRQGLRAECLSDPRRMWNAALAFCFANGRKGEEAARKVAYRIWNDIYPNNRLPRGLYDQRCDYDSVRPDEYALIEREQKRWWKLKPSKPSTRKVPDGQHDRPL